MEKVNDGGPAFPFTPHGQQCIDGKWDQSYDPGDSGMSLRDWFAGMALQGELASQGEYCNYSNHSDMKDITCWTYEVADAMLAARQPTPDK
jgi:hypothetical protein